MPLTYVPAAIVVNPEEDLLSFTSWRCKIESVYHIMTRGERALVYIFWVLVL